MRKTIKQLEKELKEKKEIIASQCKELDKRQQCIFEKDKKQDELLDRHNLVAKYMQVLRVLPDYTNYGSGTIQKIDFDRVLDVLERDRYPEGF